jgi:hypothetical protein
MSCSKSSFLARTKIIHNNILEQISHFRHVGTDEIYTLDIVLNKNSVTVTEYVVHYEKS